MIKYILGTFFLFGLSDEPVTIHSQHQHIFLLLQLETQTRPVAVGHQKTEMGASFKAGFNV